MPNFQPATMFQCLLCKGWYQLGCHHLCGGNNTGGAGNIYGGAAGGKGL